MGATDGPGRTAFAIRDALAWPDLVEIVTTAERTGFESVFLPEIAGREAFSTLAALAGHTSTLGLATGVVTSVSRKPQVTAMAAATLADLSEGRAILGLGTGPAGAGALGRLRGYVETVRGLLDGDTVDLVGEGPVRLSLEPARPVPIWLAALGPRATDLVGATGDGAILNWCTPERVARARSRIHGVAERAGRDPSAITIGVYVRAVIGQDPGRSLTALRVAAAQYASYPAYRRQFDAMGLGEGAAAASRARREGRPGDVPESFVRALCVSGDPGDAARRLQAYRDAGADVVIVYPVPVLDPTSSIMGTLFALAPHPAVED